MTNDLEHSDRRDPIARLLRQQADEARLQSSSELRERTLAALREPTAALSFSRAKSSFWSWSMAAAAMITLAFLAVWTMQPTIAPVGPSRSNVQALRDLTAPMRPPVARLASFTQPLEREAAALRGDLKRLTDRVRKAIPMPRKPAGDQLSPSL